MPNHVSHKLIFAAEHLARAQALIGGPDCFDFARLIPPPIHMYRGDLTSSGTRSDERDFPCNWYNWNTENWGTKWNAYDVSHSVEGDKAVICFDTAWATPRPVIVAFANSLLIDFELRYYDEGGMFWGSETWTVSKAGSATRKNVHHMQPEDERRLCIELKGYDPKAEEEDA